MTEEDKPPICSFGFHQSQLKDTCWEGVGWDLCLPQPPQTLQWDGAGCGSRARPGAALPPHEPPESDFSLCVQAGAFPERKGEKFYNSLLGGSTRLLHKG